MVEIRLFIFLHLVLPLSFRSISFLAKTFPVQRGGWAADTMHASQIPLMAIETYPLNPFSNLPTNDSYGTFIRTEKTSQKINNLVAWNGL